ncbi:MAG: 4-hydroxy-tetrahydrodipicolinate reductase [Sphingobacteriia bacterium]|nr:4-hydroxy-tetrahydrodipicolinate reductase [Sphingobacteriia bacterium]
MNIIVIGASGKTGSQIVDFIYKSEKHKLVGLIVSDKSDFLNKTHESGIPYSSKLENYIKNANIIIDFSKPESTLKHIETIAKFNKPLVIGTTGINENSMEMIREYSKKIPILYSSNFSLGVNLLKEALQFICKKLDNDFDIEIIEAHHRHKIDAPSGTSLSLANSIIEVMPNKKIITNERFNPHKREANEIGMAVVRGGNVFGEHEVRFIGDDEEIFIGHTAFNRKTFAKGSLMAAEWLINQPFGFYKFKNIL